VWKTAKGRKRINGNRVRDFVRRVNCVARGGVSGKKTVVLKQHVGKRVRGELFSMGKQRHKDAKTSRVGSDPQKDVMETKDKSVHQKP